MNGASAWLGPAKSSAVLVAGRTMCSCRLPSSPLCRPMRCSHLAVVHRLLAFARCLITVAVLLYSAWCACRRLRSFIPNVWSSPVASWRHARLFDERGCGCFFHYHRSLATLAVICASRWSGHQRLHSNHLVQYAYRGQMAPRQIEDAHRLHDSFCLCPIAQSCHLPWTQIPKSRQVPVCHYCYKL